MKAAKKSTITGIVNDVNVESFTNKNGEDQQYVIVGITDIKGKNMDLPVFRTLRRNIVKNQAYQFTMEETIAGETQYTRNDSDGNVITDETGEAIVYTHTTTSKVVVDVLSANARIVMMQLERSIMQQPVEESIEI